jgi:isopenicillin N synthase-like dioxygenase
MSSSTTSTSNVDTDFSSIPILDYSLLSSPTTRHLFISQLQHALINVGFLYLSNHPVPASTIDTLVSYIPKLFGLPQAEKEKIRMVHSPHFLGYSRLGAELTKGKIDIREQFDIGTKHETRWKEGLPVHWKVWGPSQVPYFSLTALQLGLILPTLSYTYLVAGRVRHTRLPTSDRGVF